MGGKAALLLVLGFSTLFLVFEHKFTGLSTRAVDNMVNYYEETLAQNIAASGANIAANQLFLDPTWDADGFQNIAFSNGTLDLSVTVLDAQRNIIQVTSMGTVDVGDTNITKNVIIILQPASFSMYAYFCQIEGNIWWTSNDVVWGPFHTQDWIRVQGNPRFYGKATTKKGMKYYTSEYVDKPLYYGGYSDNVNQDLPDDKVQDLEPIATANGHVFTASSGTVTVTETYWDYHRHRWRTRTRTEHRTYDDFYLEFKGDSLTYKAESDGTPTTVLASDFAPNGLIYAKDANLHISGVVKGQYTVAAYGPSSGLGRVYLEDDIVYSEHPYAPPPYPSDKLPDANTSCTDMLGIVARNEILIADNAANNNNITIHASIYSEKEGFGAENYDTRPVSGDINLIGGIIQKKRHAVGMFSTDYWTGQTYSTRGFNKNYMYDSRFMFNSPPEFPSTDTYRIVSWYE